MKKDKSIENITRHAEWSEKAIERYLVERCTAAGLLCLKYTNQGSTGYPDRLILLPEARVVWVELKSRGERVRPMQQLRIDQLRAAGHITHVIDSKAGVDLLFFDLEEYGAL